MDVNDDIKEYVLQGYSAMELKREAIADANSAAVSSRHAELTPLHLLQALLAQRGIVRGITERVGVAEQLATEHRDDAVAVPIRRSNP